MKRIVSMVVILAGLWGRAGISPYAGLWQVVFKGSSSAMAERDWSRSVWAVPEGTDWQAQRRRELGPILAYNFGDPSSESKMTSAIHGDDVHWFDYSQVAYAGFIYLEGGKTYKFRSNIDDDCYLKIVDAGTKTATVLLDFSDNAPHTSEAFSVSRTGWHACEIRMGNGYGGAGGNARDSSVSCGISNDAGKTWKKLMDPGDESLFRIHDVYPVRLGLAYSEKTSLSCVLTQDGPHREALAVFAYADAIDKGPTNATWASYFSLGTWPCGSTNFVARLAALPASAQVVRFAVVPGDDWSRATWLDAVKVEDFGQREEAAPVLLDCGVRAVDHTSANFVVNVLSQGLGGTSATLLKQVCREGGEWEMGHLEAVKTASDLVGSLPVVQEGLCPGAVYLFRFAVSNNLGKVVWSEPVKVTTSAESFGNGASFPGLWQARFVGANADWTKNPFDVAEGTDWQTQRRRELGPLLAYATREHRVTSRVWGDQVYWLEQNDNQWIYVGYIHLEASRAYKFRSKIDDNERITITDFGTGRATTLLEDTIGRSEVLTSAAYTPSVTGWHRIEIRFSDGAGGAGGYDSASDFLNTNNLGFSSDDGATWQLLLDPGDGVLLLPERPEPVRVCETFFDGTTLAVALGRNEPPPAETGHANVFAVFDTAYHGDTLSAWPTAQRVGLGVWKGAASTFVAQVAGLSGMRYLRFVTVSPDGARQHWSETICLPETPKEDGARAVFHAASVTATNTASASFHVDLLSQGTNCTAATLGFVYSYADAQGRHCVTNVIAEGARIAGSYDHEIKSIPAGTAYTAYFFVVNNHGTVTRYPEGTDGIAFSTFPASYILSACAESAVVRYDARTNYPGRLVRGTLAVGDAEGGVSSAWDTSLLADGWHRVSRGGVESDALMVLNNPEVEIEEGRIELNEVWTAEKTHLVRNTIYIPLWRRLKIEAGAVVKFCEGTGIKIEDGGALEIVGEEGKDVIFTSADDDSVGAKIVGVPSGGVPLRGIWRQSGNAIFSDNNFVQMRGMAYGDYAEVSLNDTVAFRASGVANIPVTLTGANRNQPFSIDWVAREGSAKFGADYTMAAGRVTWERSGDGTKIISIPLVADHRVGSNTVFSIEIITNRAVNVGRRACTVTVREWDTLDIRTDMKESAAVRFDARTNTPGRVVHGVEAVTVGGNDDERAVSDWDTTALADGWNTLTRGTNTLALLTLNDPRLAVEEGRLAKNTLWASNATHVLRNTVVVPRGITLTVTTNAVVKFMEGTGIKIEDGGRLNVVGAPGADVVFTTVADDTAGEPIAGFESITNRIVGGIVAQSGAATFTDNACIQTRNFGGAPGYGTVTLHDAAADRANGAVYVPLTIATNRKQPFSVDWVATDGTAKRGVDYTAARGTVTWNRADDGTKWIRVPLTPQKTGERRTFTLALTAARGILVARGTATVTIDELDAAKTHGAVTLVEGVEASRPFAIDARVGDQPIFLADAVPVTYSGRWQGQRAARETTARVSVESDNGLVRLGEFPGDAEGALTLDLSGYRTGCYTLRHEILAKGEEKPLHTTTKTFSVVDRDTVELHGGTLTGNETWKAGKVHVVYATVVVPGIYTLFIEPGAVVKFLTGTGIDISQGGALFANAIVFTHINDDTVGGDTLADGYTVAPPMDAYFLTGNFTFGDDAELRNITQKTALTGTLNGAKMLSKGSTYRVGGTFTVANGATLTIPAGTVLKMEQGAQIVVNAGGTLKANSTRAAPVVFTSINDDSYSGRTEGSNSNPQPGDWKRIDIAGTATFDFTRIAFASDTGDRGAINGTGGTITFDNGVVESMRYECVRINRGSFVSRNSVFRDAAMGFGYYGGSGTYVYNGVVADCTIACRASNKHFVNTIFYNCLTFLESTSSSADHCAFYNPPNWGAQTATQVGKNGNIWGDPLFVDPANGDFRIREGSPCVDAADSSAAPELDYFGQPRITFTGRTNDTELAEGPLADIGICEVMPRDVTSDIDLVPEVVRTEETATPGQLLFVKWEVRNQGGAPVDAMWRDTVSLVSQDGREVVLGDKATKSAIAVGGSVFCSGYFTVPAMAEGTWYPKVNVNSYHDIFEGSLTANNALMGTGGVEVTVKETESEGEEGVVNAGAPTVKKITLPETGGSRMVRIKVPAGVTIRWGFGFVPTGSQKSGTLTSNGQDVLFRVPDGVTDVYVSMESDDGAEYDLSLEEGQIVITGVSPNTLPSSGEVTITIYGAGFTEDSKVYLVNGAVEIAPKSVQYVSAQELVATIDCGKLTAGTQYAVSVVGDENTATAAKAVSVAAVKGEGKFWAKLVVPETVRRGRTSTVYVEYGNSGNADVTAQIIQLVCRDVVVRDANRATDDLGFLQNAPQASPRVLVRNANRATDDSRGPAQDEVQFVAVGESSAAGILKAGCRYRRALEMTTQENPKIEMFTSYLKKFYDENWASSEKYISAIAKAATRVGLRGKHADNFETVYGVALAERTKSTSYAGVYGFLTLNGTPVVGGHVAVTNLDGVAASACSDSDGWFGLESLTNGNYVLVIGGGVDSQDVVIADQRDVRIDISMEVNESIVAYVANEIEALEVTAEAVSGGQVYYSAQGANGGYGFAGLPDGLYRVTARGARLSDAALVSVSNSDGASVVHLNPRCTGRIIGTVDGVDDPEATFVMACSDSETLLAVPDEDGCFEFNDILSGMYVVTVCGLNHDQYEELDPVEVLPDSTNDITFTSAVSSTLKSASVLKSLSLKGRSEDPYAVEVRWWQTTRGVAKKYYDEGMAAFMSAGPIVRPDREHNCPHNMEKYYSDRAAYAEFSRTLVAFIGAYGKTDGWKAAAYLSKSVGVVGSALSKAYNPALSKVRGARQYIPVCIKAFKQLAESGVDIYRDIQTMEEEASAVDNELKYIETLIKTQADATKMAESISRLTVYADQWMRHYKKFHYYNNGGAMWSTMSRGLNSAAKAVSSLLSLKEAYDTGFATGEAIAELQWGTEKMRDLLPRFNRALSDFRERAKKFNAYPDCCKQCFPEEPYYEPCDEKTEPVNVQSVNPNEMAGPMGLGDPETERYVKPGEWMTYTVYFENRADATAAAQEVRVTNPLSEYLDWSTFEMGEVAFGNQIDLGLSGRRGGTSEAVMKGTNTLVRTQLTLDEQTGTAEWYLRIVDPTTATGWPEDVFAGFLPPNDETFRGEGHLTYRVKVRDDAPHGVRIANAASIVFDYNEPIETDPSWWNTVARTLEAGFVEPEVAVDEGGTATVSVRGGSAERATSVQVYLSYQTASAVDLDLKNAAADYAAKQGKTTVRTKKGVPDCKLSVVCAARDGSGAVCGYTTGQGSYYAGCRASLKATARPGWAFAGWGEVVDGVTNVVGTKAGWTVTPTNDAEIVALFERIPSIRALADPADGGKVSGSGYCAAGKKVALKATANRNFTFAGWYAAGAPDTPVATTPTLVLDRSAKPAKGDARQTVLADVDGDATYFARFVGDPEVSVSVSATDGMGAEPAGKGAGKYVAGTVTGAGRYAPGKKVVLKATANRGYVFAGWREPGADGTLSRSAAYTIGAMPPDDVSLVAAFATADEDRASIAASLGGAPLAPPTAEAPVSLATNVRAGVYLEWPLAASALSETTVKVAGLPAGLRFAAKPVTSKVGTGRTAVLVTNVPANTVYGAHTAASRTVTDRRTGAVTVTPSAVKVTVTTAGRSSRTYRIDATVDPLPAWAQGTFSGVS